MNGVDEIVSLKRLQERGSVIYSLSVEEVSGMEVYMGGTSCY